MAGWRASASAVLLCLLAFTGSSCLARRRVITRKGGSASQALLTAGRSALIQAIHRQYDAVQTLSATVDMVPALGSAEKSRITEYKDVRGFILFRKPADIRIIGLFPVVPDKSNKKVSDGSGFKLYIPARNRFVIGRNELTAPSPNRLENLRPQHFLDALLVRPLDAEDKPLLENLTDEDNAAYLLHLVRENGSSGLRTARSIWFN